jgi:phosphoglycerol transferase
MIDALYTGKSLPVRLASFAETLRIRYLVGLLFLNCAAIKIYSLFLKFGCSLSFAKGKRGGRILFPLIVFAIAFTASAFLWFKHKFATVNLEQLIVHITMPLKGVNWQLVSSQVPSFLSDVLLNAAIITAFVSLVVRLRPYTDGKEISLFGFKEKWLVPASLSVLGLLLVVILFLCGLPVYIKSALEPPALFYEKNFIDAKNTDFSFPAEKRNLIVIFVESLETGDLSTEHGGALSQELMPGVYSLASRNINFSQSSGVGGAKQLEGTGWTAAALVACFTGLPMSLKGTGSYIRETGVYLPSVMGLGDILAKEGYRNYFICGSNAGFAAGDIYLKTHGQTTIWDYRYFLENHSIPKNYHVWWGFEDRKLYAFSREKLLDISAGEEPFFFVMETMDTHSVGGYLDGLAESKYPEKYENVLWDADKQLCAFISWLEKQDFYDNTTIVILGDHLYPYSAFFPEGATDRRPLNIFINSSLDADHAKNREFSHFDIFPTLLDAIGVRYNAKGIGLGRSMSRGESTLLEQLGEKQFNDYLLKKSKLYESFFKK